MGSVVFVPLDILMIQLPNGAMALTHADLTRYLSMESASASQDCRSFKTFASDAQSTRPTTLNMTPADAAQDTPT